MNTALIIFGIRSVVRLGRVTNDALEQWARDDEILFPVIDAADFNRLVCVSSFFDRIEMSLRVRSCRSTRRASCRLPLCDRRAGSVVSELGWRALALE